MALLKSNLLHPSILIKLPFCISDEFVERTVGIPITYKGKIIGYVEEAEKFGHMPPEVEQEIFFNVVIYDKKHFRKTVEQDCSHVSMKWIELEDGEWKPAELYFVEGSRVY